MKKFAWFFLFLALACAKKGTQVLKVGTDTTYPPMEYKDVQSGKIAGFDIDLMDSLAGRMGYQVEYVEVPFDGIVAGLKTGKYDAIISSFTITPEREKEVDFTTPYMNAGQSIAVRVNEEKIKSFTDLKGKKIGAQLGTTGEKLAGTVPNAKVMSFDAISAAFIDLENGQLDAIVNDRPVSARFVALKKSARLLDTTLTSENYGIALRKGDPRLERFNAALTELETSGVLHGLEEKWFK
ncbi:MAG: basic amino acid ABC transporter substrate-binding protein [candidate division Zixibacteria bacterium]|nr:basic amino acid ABC transporter substrate-binding protein [candidate division Zixibacteria bacterium]